MSHYINLTTKEVFKDNFPNCGRIYCGSFSTALELQDLLCDEIQAFPKFKNPKRFSSVIRRFEKFSDSEVIY